jgi:hypothetical protein
VVSGVESSEVEHGSDGRAKQGTIDVWMGGITPQEHPWGYCVHNIMRLQAGKQTQLLPTCLQQHRVFGHSLCPGSPTNRQTCQGGEACRAALPTLPHNCSKLIPPPSPPHTHPLPRLQHDTVTGLLTDAATAAYGPVRYPWVCSHPDACTHFAAATTVVWITLVVDGPGRHTPCPAWCPSPAATALGAAALLGRAVAVRGAALLGICCLLAYRRPTANTGQGTVTSQHKSVFPVMWQKHGMMGGSDTHCRVQSQRSLVSVSSINTCTWVTNRMQHAVITVMKLCLGFRVVARRCRV